MVSGAGALDCVLELGGPGTGAAAIFGGWLHAANVARDGRRIQRRNRGRGEAYCAWRSAFDENDSDAIEHSWPRNAYMSGDFDNAKDMVDRAVALNRILAGLGATRLGYEYGGTQEEAIQKLRRAIRLSPLDPLLYSTLTGMSLAIVCLGSLFMLSRIFISPASLLPSQRGIRVQRDRTIHHVLCIVEIAGHISCARPAMLQCVRVIFVDAERQANKPRPCRDFRRWIGATIPGRHWPRGSQPPKMQLRRTGAQAPGREFKSSSA